MSRIAKDGALGVQRLNRQLDAVTRQARVAAANYCLFHQSAADTELLDRLGTGRATMAFTLARETLHQACVMALMRIWDEGSGALSIRRMVHQLEQPTTAAELKRSRLAVAGNDLVLHRGDESSAERQVAVEILQRQSEQDAAAAAAKLDAQIAACRHLLDEAENGPVQEARRVLRSLRDQALAHIEVEPPANRPQPARKAVIGDERKLLELTLELVAALNWAIAHVHVDFENFYRIWRRAAASFWHPVRGETPESWPAIKMTVERLYPPAK